MYLPLTNRRFQACCVTIMCVYDTPAFDLFVSSKGVAVTKDTDE